ncbi:MAG: sulfite exporter TauE/SafE family protein [Halobacteriaceae archaeon]
MGTGAPPDGASVGLFAVLGLVGSVHCLGMCGPLVGLYADRMSTDDARGPTATAIRQHALFNAGRTVSYTAIGALMGALGALLYGAASLAAVGTAVRGGTGVVVGVLVVAAGVGYVTRGTATDLVSGVPWLGGLFGRAQTALRTRVDRWVDGPGVVALGMLHGLLPCPLLYPAFVYAFGTGSPATGGISLAALGLGTFPTLFVLGTVADAAAVPRRSLLHRALGAVLVALGALPLIRGLTLLADL